MTVSVEAYRDLWKKGLQARQAGVLGCPIWPQAGIAVVGDFAGIQSFVLRPVPGAGGAAKRLRSRSFRVSAYTELVARWCVQQLSFAQAQVFYSAGGRFLIAARPTPNWRDILKGMQKQIDLWAWESFQGELAFHLAGAEFDSGMIPHASLEDELERRKSQPLAEALRVNEKWDSRRFFRPAGPAEARCQGCGMTRRVRKNADGEEICGDCSWDEQRGFELPRRNFALISTQGAGDLSAMGVSMSLYEERTRHAEGTWLSFGGAEPAGEPWHLLRHLPTHADGRPKDFDDIAKCSPGARRWLGYLRIDVDNAGRHFRLLEGDPVRTWGLSRLLNTFFAKVANDLLSNPMFKNVYAVYGGGDDLFVIGPWADTLEFAVNLRELLATTVGDSLTFSAGVALAKPREHILTQADYARELLETAKSQISYGRDVGKNQMCALGTIADWSIFGGLLETAKQVTKWIEKGQVGSSFIHRVLELHHTWEQNLKERGERKTGTLRYRPLLYYQIQRNIKPGSGREWAHTLLATESQWPWVDFIARYAMLARRQDTKRED